MVVTVAVVAVAVIALWAWPEAKGPDDSVRQVEWHVNGTYSFTNRFCGDCHYGLTEFWRAQWTPVQEDNRTVAWDFAVGPRWPDADLYAVQVTGAEEDLLLWESGEVRFAARVNEPFEVSIPVEEGASAVFARAHGEGMIEAAACGPVDSCQNDYSVSLQLASPSGDVFEAEGPEDDLNLLIVPDPEAGDWTLTARMHWGDVPVAAQLVLFAEVLGGEVAEHLHGTQQFIHRLPALADGAPPGLWIRLQPHHDHRLYENSDWDLYDSSPFVGQFQAAPGPAPEPHAWTPEAIDALWGGNSQRVFLERSGEMTVAYMDEPGHNDPGVGSSYPAFGPLGQPVPAGTSRVVFELTWEPPTAQPDFGIRFSPAGTPYFFNATPTTREPGRALFETEVIPDWWEHEDQVLAWLDPDRVTGYWDIAPRLVEEPGAVRATSLEWNLSATAVR